MASDINKVILIGRLVRDPELKVIPNGTGVANFSIANNRSYTQSGEKKENTSFFNCIAWGKLGEIIVQYCKKGQRIGIEGRLQQRSWEDKDGKKHSLVEIVAENFQFLEAKREEDNSGSYQHQGGGSVQSAPEVNDERQGDPFSDEDIPF